MLSQVSRVVCRPVCPVIWIRPACAAASGLVSPLSIVVTGVPDGAECYLEADGSPDAESRHAARHGTLRGRAHELPGCPASPTWNQIACQAVARYTPCLPIIRVS